MKLIATNGAERSSLAPNVPAIAEVIPGNGFAEILLVSHLGRLQIFDMKLVERFSYGEPGVVDFKVIQAGPTVELAVLTTRGHLVKLAWNTAVTPPSAAARDPLSRSSFHSRPGSRKWTWLSITPGST